MEIDDLLKLMDSQFTSRKFETTPVPEENLEKIFKAARSAPSGANTQPWEFIVIKNSGKKERIAEILAEAQKNARKQDKEFPHGKKSNLYERIVEPPVLIVVCADTRFKKAYPKVGDREGNLNVSMGVVIQNMMLAAKAMGLSLSWNTVDSLSRRDLQNLLNVPDYLRIIEVLQLGYPAKSKPPSYRREIGEFVHEEELDTGKLRKDDEIKDLISSRKTPNIYSGIEENKK